ncbi:hypothetical protein DUT91_02560 [Phyllobacterium salinisoli]|uniref:DUF1440 domain-containing protein n=2 Tax=Phyllobacterium salinisoli TaxID=1899321 RepID=A0A368KBH8_9HYPH|nr:hypothetical protein DUT91_02560 [Phyllobacterium salinisoli]
MAMTAAMRQMFFLLKNEHRYPLPPREIMAQMHAKAPERTLRTETVLAHFSFGAATGALYALLPRRLSSGPAYGVLVWALSYLGWIPALCILSPATKHPMQRNLLMVAAHVVWGLALSGSLRELDRSAHSVFSRGVSRDAISGRRK